MPAADRLHLARERLTAANEHARLCALFLSQAGDVAEGGMRMRAMTKANEALQAAAAAYHKVLTQCEQPPA